MRISKNLDANQVACPNTGRIVTKEQVTLQTDANGVSMWWWRCPACHRWHTTWAEPHKSKIFVRRRKKT